MSDRWLNLLLTQAWQLTLVIAVVAILSRRIARKRPHLAVALWLIVLAKAITPPVWSSPLGIFSWSVSTARPPAVEVAHTIPNPPPLVETAAVPIPESLPAMTTELPSLPDEPDTAVLPFELASPVETTPRPIDVAPLQPARRSWADAVLTIWLSGAALTLLVICSRLLHLWRTLSRAGSGPHAELAAHVEKLRKRLKLRRRVRVWVTSTDHGPAVLGLIRPWLLLPKTLVDSVAPDDLEPLLAHELLHIRRGDLWIGWWQAVVQAAWWLHPLVWWSNRVLTRQLERCCDEEVLAELGCEPGRYARGLLKALELKHRLRPVPAAPGVRPVDLTAERMERIMRMGQGSRRRTPWWCWGVLGVGLLVALPGAGLKLGAEEPGKVLFGMGVISEAGVTGTAVLGDEAPSKPRNPGTLPTVEEILKIHRENRAQLNPLHVRVTVTHEKTNAAKRQAEAEVKRLTELLPKLGDDDVVAQDADGQKVTIASASLKAELRHQIQFAEFVAGGAPHTSFLELFLDGENYQTRTLTGSLQVKRLDKWAFSDEPITPQNLKTIYNDYRIYSRSTRLTPPARIWHGSGDERPAGPVMVTAKHVTSTQSLELPPYADQLDTQRRGVHPIDQMMSQDKSRFRVAGTEIVDGRTLTIIEVIVPTGQTETVADRNGKMAPSEMAEFYRGWLDLERGAIPVKIEQRRNSVSGSFATFKHWGVDKVHSVDAIRQLESGGFYPVTTTMDFLGTDPEAPPLTPALREEINAGRASFAKASFERVTWSCSIVESRFPHDEKFFVLNFPEGTEYIDLETGTKVGAPPHASPLRPGRPAPELSIARWVGGTRQSLQDSRGRVVVLNFGGLTSKATDGTREALKRLQVRYRAHPVTFLSVQPADKSPDSVAVRLQEQAVFQDWTIPTAIDAGTMRENSQTYHAYGIESSDGNVVIDPTGQIVFHSDAVFAELNEEYASIFVEDELDEKKAKEKFEAIMKPVFAAIGEPWPPREDLTPEQNTALSIRIQEYMLSQAIDEALKKVASRGRAEPQQPPADAARGAAAVPERCAPLDQRVTMTIKDRPLDALLAELAPKYKISFVIDNAGLEEEGVLSSVPVSGEFHDVTLRTMLTLLVGSHNLVAHEQDRVLKITSRGRSEPLEVRTYAAADLLVPLPGADAKANTSSDPRKDAAAPIQSSKELIALIQSTIAPDSWIEGGGKGAIQLYEANLSLVIRQRQSVHEQIAELFDQLRRRHDTQISLQLVERVLTAEEWRALSPDGHRQMVLKEGAAGLSAANSRKATFFNGQRAMLSSELDRRSKAQASLLSFDVIPVIAEDQKSVTLILLPTSHLSRFIPRSISIPDGQTALLDISDTLPANDPALQNGGHVVLQITPRVIVLEEPGEANK